MSYRRTLMLVLALGLTAVGAGCASPEPGREPSAAGLSLDEEVALGRAAAPAFEQSLGGRCANLAVQAYVRTVGQRVTRPAQHADVPYRFAVLDADSPCTAGLPGGVVYVTRGLLKRLDSEAQLAAGLARQVAHADARRLRRALERRLGLEALRRAAVAEPQAADGETAPAVAAVARAVRDLSFPADLEREADRAGLDYLAAAGYNPRAMAAYLERTGAGEERIQAARDLVERKYPARLGRVADEEYRREVLDRLAPHESAPAGDGP